MTSFEQHKKEEEEEGKIKSTNYHWINMENVYLSR